MTEYICDYNFAAQWWLTARRTTRRYRVDARGSELPEAGSDSDEYMRPWLVIRDFDGTATELILSEAATSS